MVFIPVSYSILVIISDLAATPKRQGRADGGEGGPKEGRGRPEREGRADGEAGTRSKARRERGRRFDGVREKDYICVLALKRV